MKKLTKKRQDTKDLITKVFRTNYSIPLDIEELAKINDPQHKKHQRHLNKVITQYRAYRTQTNPQVDPLMKALGNLFGNGCHLLLAGHTRAGGKAIDCALKAKGIDDELHSRIYKFTLRFPRHALAACWPSGEILNLQLASEAVYDNYKRPKC